MCSSCRITTAAATKACCAACTIKSIGPKANWYAWWSVRYSTWLQTSARIRPDLDNGSVKYYRPRINGKCRCLSFAHGFVILSKTADFLYKTTNYYAPEHEHCIAWDDSTISIQWCLGREPTLPAKDRLGNSLAEAECFE